MEKGNHNRRLLIVDNESDVLFLLKNILDTHCYELHLAHSGDEAFNILSETTCDVLLTDIHMPGMDGIELIEKALQLQPDLQCMIMTGHGDTQSAITAMKMGATNYFLKPINIEEILLAIDRSMEKVEMSRTIKQQIQEICNREKILQSIFKSAQRASV